MNTTQIRIQIFFAILVWCAGGITSARAQSFWNDLTISVEFAAAHHDKRTSSRKEKPPSIFNIPSDSEERWAPWQYGISLNKKVLEWKDIRLDIGLGYSLEHLTYLRPVDHCFHLSGDFCFDISISCDNYKRHLGQIPIRASFPIVGDLKVELLVLPLFDIYKKAWRPSGDLIGEKMTIDFYSLEINPGIQYQINRIGLAVNYRLYQVKKIDRVIFSSSSEKIEHYNPLKFWFSVGYRLGMQNNEHSN